MKTKPISRRDFLSLTATAGVSALPIPWKIREWRQPPGDEAASASAFAPEAVNIVIMYHSGELSGAQVAQFNTDYAPLTLTRMDVNLDLYLAMYAAGNPPDLLRVQAPDIPWFLAHGILRNLQSHFDASTALQLTDLEAVNNYYKANDSTGIGEGDLYGMTADWSPDCTLWVNETLFDAAGVAPPDPASMPLGETDLVALCTAVTNPSAGRIGFDLTAAWIDRYWMMLAKAAGGSLYSGNFRRANIVGNSAVVDAIRFFYDLAADGLMTSPLNPGSSWAGPDFVSGRTAMISQGYWFHGFALGQSDAAFQQAIANGKIKMYPNFTWRAARYDPCHAATGAIMSSSTSYPDQAWTVFEWFMGKEPAHDRATSGWGLPALKSLQSLVPKVGPLSAQAWATVQAELPYSEDLLHYNPYLRGGEPNVPGQVFLDNWGAALNGSMTFDELLALIESETNDVIGYKVHLPLLVKND